MDIQLAGSNGVFTQLDGNFLVKQRAIVRNQNGCLAACAIFHRTVDFIAFCTDHSNGITHGQRIGFQIHCHVAIQGNHSQSAVGHHNVCHIVLLIRVEDLHPAGNTGFYVCADLVALCLADLLIQRVNIRLQLGHCGTDRTHIHGGDQITRIHTVTVTNQNIGQFHTGGDAHRFRIHILQCAGSGDHGADGTGGNLVGQHFHIGRSKLLPHPAAQNCHTNRQDQSQHDHDNQDRTDDLAFFLLF